tara:strand:- start:384 stop:785 length:402 start_codon:yes stop_codon:yes gene_type:complete
MSSDEEVPWSDYVNEVPWANPTKNSSSSVQVAGATMSGQFTQTNATLAVVLAAIGAILLVGSGGGGICCSIPAIILANGALTITNSQPGHPDAGTAKAAQIIGWIVTAITILFIIGFLLIIAGIGSLGLIFGS